MTFYVITKKDDYGSVTPKNIWLAEHGLKFGKDWNWNFANNGTNHIHTFDDKHKEIGLLFALRWS